MALIILPKMCPVNTWLNKETQKTIPALYLFTTCVKRDVVDFSRRQKKDRKSGCERLPIRI